jgi:hypothetical protein
MRPGDRDGLRRAIAPPPRHELWQTAPSCGANSLYFMLRLLGADLAMDEMRRRVAITGKGANLAELKTAGNEIGYDLEVRRVTLNELVDVALPSIALLGAHEKGEMGHFVMLYHVNPGGESLAIDGTTGHQIAISKSAMSQEFSGFVLTKARGLPVPLFRSVVFVATLGVCLAEVAYLLHRVLGRWQLKSPTRQRGLAGA